ncbi:hypothetical protein KCP77_01835 [Salmonella enterica subsp. enterica]|nr:hypothetical protein KCP77_01835 [Salmonella enterica subsp. enterica]
MNNELVKRCSKPFWGRAAAASFRGDGAALIRALWDIKGKAWGVPPYTLGRQKPRENQNLRQSATVYSDGSDKDMLTEPEQYAQAALTAVSEGATQ